MRDAAGPDGESDEEAVGEERAALAAPRSMKTIVQRTVARMSGRSCDIIRDDLVVEEPLEVWVDGMPYAVLMRLPGDDLDLVRGFCLTEGVVAAPSDLVEVRRCPQDRGGANRVLVALQRPSGEHLQRRESRAADAGPSQASLATTAQGPGSAPAASEASGDRVWLSRSSCGLCGRQHIEEVRRSLPPVPRGLTITCSAIQAMRLDFESTQHLFPGTGGTHGAALYDGAGRRLAAAEDIGRHNALDKVVGAAMRQGVLERARVGLVSSRLSFEMVQKAAAAGLEVLAGLSAATSLAADLAEAFGLTLAGFLRDGRMNVYTHPERLDLPPI